MSSVVVVITEETAHIDVLGFFFLLLFLWSFLDWSSSSGGRASSTTSGWHGALLLGTSSDQFSDGSVIENFEELLELFLIAGSTDVFHQLFNLGLGGFALSTKEE